MGKGERDGCPLAKLIVEKSGIQDHTVKLGKPRINLEGWDYQIFFRVPPDLNIGVGEMALALDYLPGRTFRAKLIEGRRVNGVSIGVMTWYTDSSGRPVEFTAFLGGVNDILQLPQDEQWSFFKSLFPGVKFQEFAEKPESEELKKLVEQQIIPHMPISSLRIRQV